MWRMNLSLSWIGGFFDGEGCVGLYPRNYSRNKTYKYYVLCIDVSQAGDKGREVLNELKRMYGGTVFKKKSGDSFIYSWNVSANKAHAFLESIAPYSILKYPQIQSALKFKDLKSKRSDDETATYLADNIKIEKAKCKSELWRDFL